MNNDRAAFRTANIVLPERIAFDYSMRDLHNERLPQ